MVRTRIHEASLVGLLAALATFCALEARGGQPYSIVGQSGPETAATGRRPLAERIKAANRPIRIASEEALAPDEGLIPALNNPVAVEREWIPGPATVEFPEGGPALIAVEEPSPSTEPGVLPPPETTAVAAHPTTGEDAGLVGEASTSESVGADEATPTAAADHPADGEAALAAPEALPALAPATATQTARMPPPRRNTVRVTPQRREALLARLRSALAEVPRPLGLLPAPSTPNHGSRPHSGHERSAIARRPVPATSLPEPLAALPAATPTDATAAEDAPELAPEALAADATTTPPPTTVDGHAVDDAAQTDSADTIVADAAASLADSATDPAGSEPLDAAALSTESDAVANDEVAAAASAPTTETVPEAAPATRQPTTASHGQTQRNAGGQRTRAPNAPQQSLTPLDRLQARLERMPRPLGLLPAPRPSMHAKEQVRRRPQHQPQATTGQALAVTPKSTPAADVPESATSSASDAGSESAATAEQVVLDAKATELVEAAPETEANEASPDEVASDTGATAEGDAHNEHVATAEPQGEITPTAEPPAATELERDLAGEPAGEPSATAAGTTGEPSLVATDDDATPLPAATTTARAAPPAAPAAKRQVARRQPQPTVERPIRDALEAALANMPRPLGLLPQPEPVVQRRPATKRPGGTLAPRALATKSIGTRPLDTAPDASPDISQAIVASAPVESDTADVDTTLTAGNDLEASSPLPAADAPAEPATEPATLALDTAEESSEAGAPAACIEVMLTGPEEATPLGERVTLLLSIKNSGNAPAISVTPVMHFGLGLEPLGIRGRNGTFTEDGSVVFDRLADLPPGEAIELEIIAVCTGAGTIQYQGAALCGDGEARELVPADASVTVIPATVATEPTSVRRR